MPSAKELWKRLPSKYLFEEVSAQKFFIDNYIHFKMTDGKLIIFQVDSLQLYMNDHGSIKVDEEFQVWVIISKLLPSQNNYKNKLKHDERIYTLDDLISDLRIEV